MPGSLKRLEISAIVLVAVSWLAYAVAGATISRLAATRCQAMLARISGGKFDDPVVFIQGRIREVLVLMTVAVVLWLVGTAIHRLLQRHHQWQPAHGLVMGLAAFLLLNVFAAVSGATVLFWAAFFNKAQVDNFAQYQIKRALLPEVKAPKRAILIGNSQTNRSIDEVLMNQMIGKRLWTTELTQPGAHSFDLLTLTRNMPLAKGDLVICYLSEVFFFGDGRGGVVSDFFGFAECPDLIQLGGWSLYSPGSIRSGLIGQILPIYHYRNSLSQKALGWSLVNVRQLQFDTSLEPDLERQAQRRAPDLKAGSNYEFEQAAFARMVGELSAKGCDTLLIAGHIHPALQRHMNPALRQAMRGFLARLQARGNGRVTVVDGARFFEPVPGDFLDLVHFTDDSQQRFTRKLVAYLMPSAVAPAPVLPEGPN